MKSWKNRQNFKFRKKIVLNTEQDWKVRNGNWNSEMVGTGYFKPKTIFM